MSEASLDQIVKGAPPPNVSLPSVAAAAASASQQSSPPDTSNISDTNTQISTASPPAISTSDPTSLLPSSPPQIYLNLLILEASLRSQYLTLRARRRQNTFVLVVLALWIAYFVYCQFLRPRADGAGIGGSEYWLVDVIEKVALLSGIVMSLLFKLTGQWERGVRWPARWLRTTNRGLRGMNCKVVVLKGPWWREVVSHLSFLFPIGTLVDTPGSNYQQIEYYDHSAEQQRNPSRSSRRANQKNEVAEEDIARGGDYIKILLLPKHFTPEFRDNWDTYRAEYWDAENQRRAELRHKFRAREKQLAKQQSPWFWWMPGRQSVLLGHKPATNATAVASASMRMRAESEKPFVIPSGVNVTHGGSQRQRRAASVIKEEKGSQSRSSSRSSLGRGSGAAAAAATVEADERERRWSTSTTSSIGGERRRRKATGTSGTAGADAFETQQQQQLQQQQQRRNNPAGRVKATRTDSSGTGGGGNSRPTTPNPSTTGASAVATGAGTVHILRSQPSNLSSVSSGSDGDTPPRHRAGDVAIKKEPMD